MDAMQKNTAEFRDLSDDEIVRLIEGLDSISEGELGVAMLVACGARAIPMLREFLLHGTPRSIYVGRQRTVRAMAELGAASVLIEYLSQQKRIADPMVRYAEEAVENTAACSLARWQTDEAFATLLHVVERQNLPGAVEALGAFGRPEAAPALIRCLEDDVARPRAKDSLRRIGARINDHLVETVRSPEPGRANEYPGSLLRRTAALDILAEFDVTAEDWRRLRFLLFEDFPMLKVLASSIALRAGDEPDGKLGIQILLDHVSSQDWTVASEAGAILAKHFSQTKLAIHDRLHACESKDDLACRNISRALRALIRQAEHSRGDAA